MGKKIKLTERGREGGREEGTEGKGGKCVVSSRLHDLQGSTDSGPHLIRQLEEDAFLLDVQGVIS